MRSPIKPTTPPSHRLRILLFDRDLDFISLLQRHLYWQGYEVFSARDRRSAERLLGRMPISLLLTSLEPTPEDALEDLELLHLARRHQPTLKTVLFTGASSSSLAIGDAIREADAHLSKPIDLEQLRLTLLGLLETD